MGSTGRVACPAPGRRFSRCPGRSLPIRPTVPGHADAGTAVGDVSPDTAPQFDAVGMQSVLTRARDQSRFVPPTIEDEGGWRPVPVRALIVGLAVGGSR